MESREGVNRLAGVLQNRTKLVTEKPSMVDVGEIQSDLSLLTNKFPMSIPKSDYMVCRSVTWGKVGDLLEESFQVGESTRWLQSGDRVLVVWLDDCDPCVVDLIVSGSSIG